MIPFRKLFGLLKNKFVLYLLLTWIACTLISYLPAKHQSQVIEADYKTKSQDYANFHINNLENFLSETVGRLEMLATSINVTNNKLDDVENILYETVAIDPRFSGFYWATPNGDLLISTTITENLINISDLSYFQQAVKTERTSISEPYYSQITGRYIISIATPVVNHNKVQGVLIASLRMDEIEAAIRDLVTDEIITVADKKGKILIKTGAIDSNNMVKTSMHVTQVPWTITAFIDSDKESVFRDTYLIYFVFFLTGAHILYLLVHYFLLKNRVKNEKEQAELQKLELIGRLAASTAHEIRNPLTGIKGLVKLLSEEQQDYKSQFYFEVIQTEIDRINAIVSELLVLGKPTVYHINAYNVNDIIAEIEPIIRSEAHFVNVEIETVYSPDPLPVSCVKDQLKQVILNLTKNSLQAMPFGGKLAISLEQRPGYCFIKVADNGVGMTEEQISSAFNPFYTLKKDGSGLGLTVCKRIIATYGGEIFIRSTPKQGTAVEILLPLIMD